jgi:hypothetical protein
MTVKLLLTESSKEITDVCKSVEKALVEISELKGLSLTVKLLGNFDDLLEADESSWVKNTGVIYRDTTQTIYVNRSTFSLLSGQVQEATFVHEIARALVNRESLMDIPAKYAMFGRFGEAVLIDYLACKWGFLEGLRAERMSSYGQHYIEALNKWRDENEYIKAMNLWRARKGAGYT